MPLTVANGPALDKNPIFTTVTLMSSTPSIIYTITDEAPALATF